jgi:hypothetical protein
VSERKINKKEQEAKIFVLKGTFQKYKIGNYFIVCNIKSIVFKYVKGEFFPER